MSDDRQYRFSWDFIGDIQTGRPNLGSMIYIEMYRLFQYTMRDALEERYGTEESDRLFYRAGFIAGEEFGKKFVGKCNSLEEFFNKASQALVEFKVSIMRLEEADLNETRFMLTMAEDMDCSGLPDMGHGVCTYDEGFIAGLFFSHTGEEFKVQEVDCWCTGDRTCRFEITR